MGQILAPRLLATWLGMTCLSLVANPALPATVADPQGPIPLDALFSGSQLNSVSVSPDGHYLALIVTEGPHAYVAVKDLTAVGAARPVLRADPSQHMEPRSCSWANSTRMLCRVTGYVTDRGGWAQRLVALNADGGDMRILTHYFNDRTSDAQKYNVNVLDLLSDDHDNVLIRDDAVSAVQFVRTFFPGAALLNVYNGQIHPILDPEMYVSMLTTDGKGQVRFGGGVRDSTDSTNLEIDLVGRPLGQNSWKRLSRVESHKHDVPFALGPVNPGTNTAYAIFLSGTHTALWRVDLGDASDPQVAYADPDLDVTGMLLGAEKRLLGVGLSRGSACPIYLDPEAQSINALLTRSMPDLCHGIVDTTPDMKLAISWSWGPASAPVWYLVDRRGPKSKIGRIGATAPDLAAYEMSRTLSGTYIASDGASLPIEYTVPQGAGAASPPLIVWLRGPGVIGNFDYSAHYFASHGYAVAIPRLRGAAAQADWGRAPFQDWGGLLYRDVLAATRTAIAAVHADPGRVCIVGEAYSGYTALVAAMREDSPFKCVATEDAYTDLYKARRRARQDSTAIVVGSREDATVAVADRESPRDNAAAMRVPILLIDNDHRENTLDVPDTSVEQGGAMDAALARAGKTHEHVVIHSSDNARRREWYTALERFFGEYLPVR